ncbi:MAG TPA: thioredoxin domain-containing protein [Gemmataceae bacterium]|nr:thioredoxin domain-containing protein [Gemmataceae bacterium]
MGRQRAVRLAAILIVGLLGGAGAADEPKKDAKKGPANRLARESSPYLLQHAHNPVDWYPWGPEAFEKAKKEGKLVFLSIGYSSCHWCHVMERESFANKEIAQILNDHFVCIKVDREERPDIDYIYMTALNVLGQQGGWPLSMFLTADGKPIIGGTYWPPEDREIEGQKLPGFKTVLRIIRDFHKDQPKDLQEQADKLAAATADALAGTVRGVALVELNRDLVTGAVEGLKEEFDKVHGGFGHAARRFRGPKFPTPPYLLFLQREAARTQSAELADMVHLTLDQMAIGGIYDHLGGGFHRYSTERTWTVPHFEKMLYDNAQLAEVYAHAYRATRKPLYRRVLEETLAFVARELTSPEGAFYSALDADTDGEEGKTYLWTTKEIEEALGAEGARLFLEIYGDGGKPNFESKFHILRLAKPLAEIAKERKTTEPELEARLAPLRKKLLEVRSQRAQPFRDTKVLTAWNGEMIAGYAVAGQVLEEPQYVQAAARAADFVLTNLRTGEGRLLRTYGAVPGEKPQARLNAYLDDYAFLVHGLLCLHDATGEKRWLDEAKALTDTMVKWHADKQGGFFYTSNDHEKLFARAKDQYDGAQPSGNSAAAKNLVRLWVKTGDDRYRQLAEKSFKVFAGTLKANPTSLTTMAEALAMYLDAQKK